MSFQSSIIQESEPITTKSSPQIQFQPKTPFLKPCESPEFEIDDFALPEAIDDFEEEQIEDYMEELTLENGKSSEPSIETSLHFKEKKENRREIENQGKIIQCLRELEIRDQFIWT